MINHVNLRTRHLNKQWAVIPVQNQHSIMKGTKKLDKYFFEVNKEEAHFSRLWNPFTKANGVLGASKNSKRYYKPNHFYNGIEDEYPLRLSNGGHR